MSWAIIGRGQGWTRFHRLTANVVFGLAMVLVWHWVAGRYSDRLANWPAMQRLMDDTAGRNLNQAARFLAELAVFKADPDM